MAVVSSYSALAIGLSLALMLIRLAVIVACYYIILGV